jgi:hypothetical protein
MKAFQSTTDINITGKKYGNEEYGIKNIKNTSILQISDFLPSEGQCDFSKL